MSKRISIRVDLVDELCEKILKIKEDFGLKSNSEVIRTLITKRFQELHES
jgi:predicted CopG family antitoxin